MSLSVSFPNVLIDPALFSFCVPPSWYLSDAFSPHSVMCHGSGAERRVVGPGGGCRGLAGGSWRRRGCSAGERTSAPGCRPQRPHRGAAGLSAAASLCELPGVRAPSCQTSLMPASHRKILSVGGGCSNRSTINAAEMRLTIIIKLARTFKKLICWMN